MGTTDFWSPTNLSSLDRLPNICHRWLHLRQLPQNQIWCKSAHGGWGFWANAWNITKFLFIYLFIYLFTPSFWELTYRQDQLADFRAWWLKWRRLVQGCAFFGFCLYCCPFLGSNFPETRIFVAQIGIFKPNMWKIQTFILSKLLHRLQPNFAKWWRPPSTLHGWSKYAQTNPRWQWLPSLKIERSQYLRNGLTNFDEIWHGSVSRPSRPPQLIKIWEFSKSKMAVAAILEKSKDHNISAMDWQILVKFGTVMHLGSPEPVSQ